MIVSTSGPSTVAAIAAVTSAVTTNTTTSKAATITTAITRDTICMMRTRYTAVPPVVWISTRRVVAWQIRRLQALKNSMYVSVRCCCLGWQGILRLYTSMMPFVTVILWFWLEAIAPAAVR